MIKNYLKVGFRNFRRQKLFSLINVFGLALGMACTILIYSFIESEVSYDKFFNNSDRIYRARLHAKMGESEFNMANSPAVLAGTLLEEFPQIDNVTRLVKIDPIYFKNNDDVIKEEHLIYADSSFFSIFSVEMIQGDPVTALNSPNSIVLTEESSIKYFGNLNSIGKVLITDTGESYHVTGVVKKLPQNTHFNFDFLASMLTIEDGLEQYWLGNQVYTYFLLKKEQNIKSIEQKLPDVIKKYVEPQISAFMGISFDEFISSGNYFKIEIQPLLDIHLTTGIDSDFEPGGSRNNIYIFSSITILILLLGCINFINLSTAKISTRAKEIGVRKVLGSHRKQIIKQFLSESVLLSIIAFSISLILVTLLAPVVTEIATKQFGITIWKNPLTLLVMLICAIIVGIISGFFPAMIFSGIKVINIFRGKTTSRSNIGRLRTSLVVFQFTVTTFLITSTIIIYNQLLYMRYKDIGYDQDQIFVISNLAQLGKNIDVFKEQLINSDLVQDATVTRSLPQRNQAATVYHVEGQNNKNYAGQYYLTDYDFAKTFGIKIIEGRYFSKEFSTDSNAVVLNQAAVKEFGITNPIGKRIFSFDDNNNPLALNIIGVIKDFHTADLHNKISPVVFALNDPSDRQFLSLKMKVNKAKECIELVETLWNNFNPGKPVEYFFMDQDYELFYKDDIRIGKLFTSFSVLAIFIACLGLFGLISFSAERRTKEVGVRKVLGASVHRITILLSKEFIIWVLLANIIAWPVAYYFMNKWLQDFAFRIDITLWPFLFSGLIALLIAVATVSYQSIKAAIANPVDSLKYE